MAEEKLEKDIQKEICEWLKSEGVFFWRSNNIPVFGVNNAGKRTFRSLPKFTPRGLPDIIMVVHGRFIAMEVKRPGFPLRPEQAEFGTKCAIHGAPYLLVHSLQEAVTAFRGLDI